RGVGGRVRRLEEPHARRDPSRSLARRTPGWPFVHRSRKANEPDTWIELRRKGLPLKEPRESRNDNQLQTMHGLERLLGSRNRRLNDNTARHHTHVREGALVPDCC